jgi:hypothetical protein
MEMAHLYSLATAVLRLVTSWRISLYISLLSLNRLPLFPIVCNLLAPSIEKGTGTTIVLSCM